MTDVLYLDWIMDMVKSPAWGRPCRWPRRFRWFYVNRSNLQKVDRNIGSKKVFSNLSYVLMDLSWRESLMKLLYIRFS